MRTIFLEQIVESPVRSADPTCKEYHIVSENCFFVKDSAIFDPIFLKHMGHSCHGEGTIPNSIFKDIAIELFSVPERMDAEVMVLHNMLCDDHPIKYTVWDDYKDIA